MDVCALFVHEFASVYVYVIVCVPTPAVAGLKLFPLTPVPLKVPPAGVPLRETFAASTQTALYVPASTTGSAFTVTFTVPMEWQLLASPTLTE
jgi:hypothetical protein